MMKSVGVAGREEWPPIPTRQDETCPFSLIFFAQESPAEKIFRKKIKNLHFLLA
jgi:hypothetical protein